MANNFRSGGYSIKIGGVDAGMTFAGFSLRPTNGFDYVRTDKFGDSIVDATVRGGNWRIEFQAAEWNNSARSKMTNLFESVIGTMDKIGQLVVVDNLAVPIVLTPLVAKPGLVTFTFPLCIPELDSGAFNLNNRINTPINRWLVLVDSTGKAYTET